MINHEKFLMAIRSVSVSVALYLTLFLSTGSAALINLNTWTAKSSPPVSGFRAASWRFSGGGGSQGFHRLNGRPALFYSHFKAIGRKVSGRTPVLGGDHDFIGFAFGSQAADTTHVSASYRLVNWKRGTRFHHFGLSPSGGYPAFFRRNALANAGWALNTEGNFGFNFRATGLKFSVIGTPEFHILRHFHKGRRAFYNFSRSGVKHGAFKVKPAVSAPVPEPATMVLMASGLLLLIGYNKLRSRKKTV